MKYANEILQIHTDHLGTPRAVTNAKNEKLWQWEGDAFGDVQPQVGHVKMPLRFAGQYTDDEVGLFYNYFRFYNPETGRYIENDPIDLQGGLNRCGYVNGSPLHAIDPYGFYWLPPAIPQDSYEVLIGYSDSLSFGIAPYIRTYRFGCRSYDTFLLPP